MITRYSDHAANERTFLAWVRTAIAMMAFGFVIERFDLFLRYAAPLAAQQKIAPHGGAYANAAGLAFIVLGIAIIVIAGWRFAQTAKDIDSDNEVASPGERFDLALRHDWPSRSCAVSLPVARHIAADIGRPFGGKARRRGDRMAAGVHRARRRAGTEVC